MLEGRGVNQTDTWIKTPGRRLVHFSDKPTIRPSDGIQAGIFLYLTIPTVFLGSSLENPTTRRAAT